jgi:NADH dehydrogenase (ubiquinone) 1 alpha/beta subcomplex 1, acyl-carrier protein
MWRFLLRKFGTASELEYKITEILKRFESVDKAKISSTASFKDLGLDSLDSVEAVVAMEEILGTELPDEEALKIQTIPDAIAAFSKIQKLNV